MVKTLTFNPKGDPVKLEKGATASKNLHWMHIDQTDDQGYADLISYELSDLGLSHDISQHLRPNIRYSEKYQIIKLIFPREAGIYRADKENLIVRFIVSKNLLISVSNYSDELMDIMNSIYINKKKIKNISELFTEINSVLLHKSYETVENLDSEINKIQKNIFANHKKKEHFQLSENIRENVYHAFMFISADIEVFEELRHLESKFIKFDHKMEHLKSKLHYLRDVLGGQRENLLHMSDIYLGILSANVNKYMYKLTILSAILLVPTVVAGFYGMNVPLPPLNFWTIVSVTIGLSLIMGYAMSVWARR